MDNYQLLGPNASSSLYSLLKIAGIETNPTDCFLLKGGANNRVFKIVLGSKQSVVLKQYFSHPQDLRPRLKAEYEFLQYAWAQGIRTVPEPLSCNILQNEALYSYIDGPLPSRVEETFVQAAASFLIDLNRNRSQGKHLLKASEACFQISDFFAAVERRLPCLDEENELLQNFLQEELLPTWSKIKEDKCKAVLHPLEPSEEDLILTPSDFGLHNVLLSQVPHFIDFEYAGWDDPAKTICDFFLQPKIPIPMAYFDFFSQSVAHITKNPVRTLERTKQMFPVCKMKWCCIILNVFSKAGASRRSFAQSDQIANQEKQIELARLQLKKLLPKHFV